MLEQKLKNHHFHPLFNFPLNARTTQVLNLGKSNEDAQFKTIKNADDLERYIQRQLKINNKEYGYGGYGENRTIYSRFSHFNDGSSAERHHHLGVDVWAPAHTWVYAPARARVHSLAFNASKGDYGGTVILTHSLAGETFYTLYGHLSKSSVNLLREAQEIKAGEAFAELGEEHENVGWPPHLHFQIILDMQGYRGDFPGVVSAEKRAEALANCPNPELILRTGL